MKKLSLVLAVLVAFLVACGPPQPTPVETTETVSQASVFPTFSFYSWGAGQPTVTMTPVANSFCFPIVVTGSFRSGNDTAQVSQAFSTYWGSAAWAISGSGGITGIEAECVLENVTGSTFLPSAGIGMTTHWLSATAGNVTTQNVAPTSGNFCFLLSMAGEIASSLVGQDDVDVFDASGEWTQRVEAKEGTVVSEVGCVATTRALNPLNGGGYCSTGGRSCSSGSTLPSSATDVCALTDLQGDWSGNAFGQIVINANGTQSLATSTTGHGAQIGSVCAGP